MMIDFQDIENKNPAIGFLIIAMFKSAIISKRHGFNQEMFLDLSRGIWESIELNDIDELEKIMNDKMKGDVDKFIKEYKK